MAERRAIDVFVGARVQLYRVLMLMTEAQLAAAVSISEANLRLYEVGEARIPADILLKIADVLGKKISQLFEDAEQASLLEEGGSAVIQAPQALREQQATLVSAYARLTPLQRLHVLNYVQSLADKA